MLKVVLKDNQGLAYRDGILVAHWRSSYLYGDAEEVRRLVERGEKVEISGTNAIAAKGILRDISHCLVVSGKDDAHSARKLKRHRAEETKYRRTSAYDVKEFA